MENPRIMVEVVKAQTGAAIETALRARSDGDMVQRAQLSWTKADV